MRSRYRDSVLQSLQRLFREGTAAGVGEGQLLDRFVVERDEAAFAAILSRHGPMVAGVCQRYLNNPQDVEDAFQATFLVLVRRGRAIRDKDLLGPWLYGVAHRVAVRSRANSARRAEMERRGALVRPSGPIPDVEWSDLAPVLDEEVVRLPERYRTPVVLCDIQGLTYEEAAQHLGCPIGTIKSRLARARERLRARLTRRGLAPTAGSLLLPGSTSGTASAPVPSALLESTIRLAQRLVVGAPLAAGSVFPPAVFLMEGALATMFVARMLKLVAAGLMAVGLVAFGVEVVAQRTPVVGGSPSNAGNAGVPGPTGLEPTDPGVTAPPGNRPAEPPDPKRESTSPGASRVIEVQLRSAIRRLAEIERLAKTGAVSSQRLEEARTEVALLQAQIESGREELRDELERLKAQLAVKLAELKVAEVQQEQSLIQLGQTQKLVEDRVTSKVDLATAKNRVRIQDTLIAVKLAEVDEVKVRIGQAERRLAGLDWLAREFLDPPPGG
jgi:RNA polymerase sigma factor (sigma-70 family)